MKPTNPVGRLVRQWRGHTVEVSPKGLTIDGRTVDPEPLTERDAVRPSDDPRTHRALQFLDSGALVYRGRVQAEIHSGEVTVHGPKGAEWSPEPARHPKPGAGPAPPGMGHGLDLDIEFDDDLDIDL